MAEEQLLGDKTAAMLRAVKADRVAKAYNRITGNKKGCKQCKQRQMKLNDLHRKLKQKNEERIARRAAITGKK